MNGETRERQDQRLEIGLEETFPASDPIAVGKPTGTEPSRRPIDRQAPVVGRSNIGRVAVATVCGSAFVREF